MTTKTANFILIIMAVTWMVISIRLGVMVEVSDKFLWLAGILAGGNIGTVVAGKLQVPRQ